jgi:hypothetical protein
MRSLIMGALLATCLMGPPAAAQRPPAAATQQALPSGAEADIVREVIAAVRKHYVFPDRAPAIVARLEQGLASGRYATANPVALAERMSADLKQSSGNDGHMYVNYEPAEAAARRAPAGPAQQPDPAYFRQMMESANYGVTELKVLPGNVRYMNISQWFWDPDGRTRAVYDDAMRFLRGGDAIIIDIRGNGGGAAEPVQYVASHFLDPGQKMMTFRQGPDQVEENRSQKIAAGKIAGKPLFVLIGPGSASASEEFASHIKHFRLGTLIGQTTAGAGNTNDLYPVAHGFVVSISTGTAEHAVSGKGWEGEGIAPDRKVELSQALDEGHHAALHAQLATAAADKKQQLEWMIAALRSDGRSSLSAEQMRALAGRYDGDRLITERDGRLYWKRGDGPELELIPLGDRLFAIGQKFGSRAEFDPDGGALTIRRPGAPPERVTKSGA